MTNEATGAGQVASPKLPSFGAHLIPGLRHARTAVRGVLWVFAGLALTAMVASTLLVVRITVQGDGVLEPETVRRVRVAEPGLITGVLAKTGDTVQMGQVLVTLDTVQSSVRMREAQLQEDALRNEIEVLTRSIPISRERAVARVASAEARVSLARASLRQRMAEFGMFGDPDSLVSVSPTRTHVGMDGAVAEYVAAIAARSEVTAETLSLSLADLEIAHKRIELNRVSARSPELLRQRDGLSVRSPSLGVVVTEDVRDKLGAVVAPGELILEVADLDRWRAIVTLSERDAHRVRVGDTADVEILALASRENSRFQGTVRSVGRQPAANGSTATGASTNPSMGGRYRADIGFNSTSLSGVQPLLRRGYFVRARVASRRGTVLTLVREYVRERRRVFR
jgi:multidrug resistance efflux pump